MQMEYEAAEALIGQRPKEVEVGQAKGWTQESLAVRVGTIQAVIQKIENGKSSTPRCLSALAVNPAWLAWGEPYAYPEMMVIERDN